MSVFLSKREKRLWLLVLLVVIAIYATLGLSPILAGFLRDRGLISDGFWLGLALIGLTILAHGLRTRPGGYEIATWLGIAGVYLLVFLRMNIPEERSHLIEYSVVAIFILEALRERVKQGGNVYRPPLLAIALTTLIGLLDECIQFFLPGRVYDLFDISFNFLAALMAVTGSLVLAWARKKVTKY
jgi:hypothetical protein